MTSLVERDFVAGYLHPCSVVFAQFSGDAVFVFEFFYGVRTTGKAISSINCWMFVLKVSVCGAFVLVGQEMA